MGGHMITTAEILPEIDSKRSNQYSFAKLCMIAFPLMLSALSGTLMLFIDRLVLAQYNAQVMNAAAASGLVFAVFQFGVLSVAAIAEVFVGQYNGAKQYHLLAKPVWQMIWFSAMTTPLFILIGSFGANFLLAEEVLKHDQGFFSWIMYFGPFFGINAALSSFYIGQGKVKYVTFTIIFASLVNLFLDIALVFGFLFIPSLGAKGAALATGLAQVFNAFLLFIPFLGKSTQTHFHSHLWQFDSKMFWQCLKIGYPNAVGHMGSIAAWAVVSTILSKASFEHISIFAISQSIWILLTFITEGNQKAVSTVSANLIGAGKIKALNQVFLSGLCLMATLSCLLAIPLLTFPEYLVQGFLSEGLTGFELKDMVYASCKWIWLAFIFEGTTWIIAGILTSAGDTRFIMTIHVLNSWIFAVIPYFVLVNYYGATPMTTVYLMVIFSFVNMVAFLQRYRSQKWQARACII